MRVPPRTRVLPRTLRGRLIAGLLTLLVAACATVGLVTYLAVQDSLSGELNNDLQTATGLAYECSRPQPRDDGITGQPGPAAVRTTPAARTRPAPRP